MALRPDWYTWAMGLARAAASRSEDPHFAVGAVALRPDMSVVGVGYNGAPPGVLIDWTDRDKRRPFVIHAEVNALRYATLADMQGGTMVCTAISCANCLPVLASYGVKVMVYADDLGPEHDHDLIHAVARVCRIDLTRRNV